MMVKLASKHQDTNIIQIYAPTTDSSDEEIDAMYNNIEQALKQCKSGDNTIIQGDFNAKLGKERFEDIIGPHGLGTRNERGDLLAEWTKVNDNIVGNTWFKQPERRIWTWKSPDNITKNQIDYILVRKRFRNALITCKTYPSADCNTDHNLLLAKVKVRLKKQKKNKPVTKVNVLLLKNDEELKNRYSIEVKNKFAALQEDQTIEEEWQNMKKILVETSEEIIPKNNSRANQKWMTRAVG